MRFRSRVVLVSTDQRTGLYHFRHSLDFGSFPKFGVRPSRHRLPARVKLLTSTKQFELMSSFLIPRLLACMVDLPADMVNQGVMSGRSTSSKNLVWIGDRCWSSQLLSADVRIDALPLSYLGFIGRSYALAGCGRQCATQIAQGNSVSTRHRDNDHVSRATILVCMDSGRLS